MTHPRHCRHVAVADEGGTDSTLRAWLQRRPVRLSAGCCHRACDDLRTVRGRSLAARRTTSCDWVGTTPLLAAVPKPWLLVVHSGAESARARPDNR